MLRNLARNTHHDGYYEEMDWPAAGLEHDPCAAGGVLRRTYAELTGYTPGCQVSR